MKNIGVFAVIVNNGKILLGKRNYGNYGWTLPGGAVEEREDLMHALVREVKEETNQNIKIEKYVLTSYNKEQYSIALIYKCSIIGERKIKYCKRELSDVKWCDLEKLPKEITERQVKWIEYAKGNNVGVIEI